MKHDYKQHGFHSIAQAKRFSKMWALWTAYHRAEHESYTVLKLGKDWIYNELDSIKTFRLMEHDKSTSTVYEHFKKDFLFYDIIAFPVTKTS